MEVTGVDKVKFIDCTKSNDFYLFEVGRYKCVPNYSYGPIVRTRTIFHYVISGKGYLILDDKRYDIESGQGFLIPAKCKAYYEADAEDPWEYTWIHVDGPRTMELFNSAGISEENPIYIPKSDSGIILDILGDIYDHSDRECYCYAKVYEFFDTIISLSKNRIFNDVDPRLAYVKSAINFIRLKYSEPISVEEIAAACGLNRSYLSRLFKHATGYTPQEYLSSYRMKKATELLLESTESVSSIALRVGYSDAFTFSKAFKRFKSVAPSEYRKSHGVEV
ncbi:AraC family transcriptional regulator [Butyrivibrio fibrisolvens]|uniref:AraC family transcriptional regulator n=1 Tax=Pseudobutyrivibrio ruminis TaxID=46206 RepID=UPI00041F29E3|nr:AraC family transcriptional regulator [Pseudobutyrivibrio ruminis]MDC7280214.1 AraC family transcriptional regulator [Butyrivibrio fibrisolvens]